jgi:hypothetical protein
VKTIEWAKANTFDPCPICRFLIVGCPSIARRFKETLVLGWMIGFFRGFASHIAIVPYLRRTV